LVMAKAQYAGEQPLGHLPWKAYWGMNLDYVVQRWSFSKRTFSSTSVKPSYVRRLYPCSDSCDEVVATGSKFIANTS
jgi:hypothetical protein